MEDSELDSDIRMKTPDSHDGVTWGPRCCQVVFDNFDVNDVKCTCFHNIWRRSGRAFSLLKAPSIGFPLMIHAKQAFQLSEFITDGLMGMVSKDTQNSVFIDSVKVLAI